MTLHTHTHTILPGRTWTYALVGFSEEERRFVHAVLRDRRGWMAEGHRFRLWGVDRTQPLDFAIFLTPGADMAVRYPQTWLRGLSVTDRTKEPVEVHLNATNWGTLPAESEFDDLRAYRVALVNHEVGHVIGYGHSSCPLPGGPADIMQQPSKGLAGCLPNPWP